MVAFGQWNIDSLIYEYGKDHNIKFHIDDIMVFALKYKDKFFDTISPNNLKIYPNVEIKESLKIHGSLSKYLQYLRHENRKAKNKENRRINWPILISILMLIAVVVFGVFNIISSKTSGKHEKELTNKDIELNKKDSILFELNNKLLIDTIELKH